MRTSPAENLRAERMVRLVEPPAVEVVAEALDDGETELHLRRLRKRAAQAAVVRRLLLGDGAHDRHQGRAQLLEQRQHRGRRHALVGAVDQRVGDVLVGREEVGVLAAEVERLFEQRAHGGEVVGRTRARPGIVGGGAERAPAGDELGRHLGRLVEVATHDADEARIVAVVGCRRSTCGARSSSSLPSAGSVNLSCASRLKVAPCLARAAAPPLGM